MGVTRMTDKVTLGSVKFVVSFDGAFDSDDLQKMAVGLRDRFNREIKKKTKYIEATLIETKPGSLEATIELAVAVDYPAIAQQIFIYLKGYSYFRDPIVTVIKDVALIAVLYRTWFRPVQVSIETPKPEYVTAPEIKAQFA